MAAIQVMFEIPPVIQQGIDEGTLIRFGGIVRDTAGRLVKHLDEVPISKLDNGINKIVEVAKKNKFFVLGTIIVTGIAVGITYVVVKNKKNEEVMIPKDVANFNESLMNYINSVRMGTVDEQKIDDVIRALGDIKENQEKGNIDISFSVENANLLLDMVKNYTIQFAEVNSYEILEEDFERKNEISYLQHYLEIQKSVLKKSA